jgi:hypothetical protein
MKNLLLIFTLMLSTHLFAAGATQVKTETTSTKPKLRLQIEVSPQEVEPLGLKVQNLQTAIMTTLIKNDIIVQDDPSNPQLILRLKTIDADSVNATFIQLAFYEDAILKRSNSEVMALTWSQASLITTTKQDFANEVTKTVENMTLSFVSEFQKVFTTSGK